MSQNRTLGKICSSQKCFAGGWYTLQRGIKASKCGVCYIEVFQCNGALIYYER